ncbi:MAG: hypothetical protein ACLPH3_02690 [Terracidiphilus sp.]
MLLPFPSSAAINGYDRGLTDAKDIPGRVLYTYAHRIACREMYPIQRPLHVGQARPQAPDHISIGRHPKTDTVYDPEKALVRSVLAARDGSIWVGTLNGLDRWNRGQMTVYRAAPAQSRRSSGEANGAAREILDAGLLDNNSAHSSKIHAAAFG